MTSAEGKTGSQDKAHGFRATPPDRGDLSLQAFKALQRHAKMFEASGADFLNEDGRTVSLSDGLFAINLCYRSQRKLLARIDHLRIEAKFCAPDPGTVASYELRLQHGGPFGGRHGFSLAGHDPTQAERTGRRLLRSGIMHELASKVDLEGLSVSRCSKKGTWKLVLEPYPGCHVYTVFPPARYTVRLKDHEVESIRGFFVRASKVLAGSEAAEVEDEKVSGSG